MNIMRQGRDRMSWASFFKKCVLYGSLGGALFCMASAYFGVPLRYAGYGGIFLGAFLVWLENNKKDEKDVKTYDWKRRKSLWLTLAVVCIALVGFGIVKAPHVSSGISSEISAAKKGELALHIVVSKDDKASLESAMQDAFSRLHGLENVKKGEDFFIYFLLSGLMPDRTGAANFELRVRFHKPDGSIEYSESDIYRSKIKLKDQPRIYLSDTTIRMRFEPGNMVGVYKIEGILQDLTSGQTISSFYDLTLGGS